MWIPLVVVVVRAVGSASCIGGAVRAHTGGVYDLEDDFTSAQIERARSRKRDALPLRYCGVVTDLVVPCLLGFTPLGAGLMRAAGRIGGGGWVATAALGSVAVYLVLIVVGLPLSVLGERLNRRWGLSTRSWRLFAADLVKGVGIGMVLIVGVAIGLFALIRGNPDTWWAWGAPAAAALVFVASFLMPVLIEPVFNKFKPMAEGPLRDRLLELVGQSELTVRDILVSDGSRRTTAANAYVSGFGRTRRVVVWDTTVEQFETEEVAAIAAHELGHAAKRDVLVGTAVGAIGAAVSVALLGLILRWAPLLDAAGIKTVADPRSLPLLFALTTVGGAVAGPAGLAFSRRIEARADGYALDLVRDPETIVVMERRLATSNLADLEPNPLTVVLFASHPPIRARIAHARQWAAEHGMPVPGPVGSQ